MKAARGAMNRDLLDAVQTRDAARVRELLEAGADANARDAEHGETALIFAAMFAREDDDLIIVRLLIDAGAEIDGRNDAGRTALFFAPVASDVFQALLAAGADVHARDGEGMSILSRNVSRCASMAEVEELLKLGVDPSTRGADGRTAADIADELGLVKIAERLRQARA